MAQIVRTISVCDKDGCEAEAPHRHAFTFAGKSRTLDLCQRHEDQAAKAVGPWLNAAVVVKMKRKRR